MGTVKQYRNAEVNYIQLKHSIEILVDFIFKSKQVQVARIFKVVQGFYCCCHRQFAEQVV